VIYVFQIVHIEEIPCRGASYAELPPDLSEAMKEALQSIGISRLYSHQVLWSMSSTVFAYILLLGLIPSVSLNSSTVRSYTIFHFWEACCSCNLNIEWQVFVLQYSCPGISLSRFDGMCSLYISDKGIGRTQYVVSTVM
jgi:hypothetical protein